MPSTKHRRDFTDNHKSAMLPLANKLLQQMATATKIAIAFFYPHHQVTTQVLYALYRVFSWIVQCGIRKCKASKYQFHMFRIYLHSILAHVRITCQYSFAPAKYSTKIHILTSEAESPYPKFTIFRLEMFNNLVCSFVAHFFALYVRSLSLGLIQQNVNAKKVARRI